MKRHPLPNTPQGLRDIRSLKVVAIHPLDQDGEELLAQLRRIGCRVCRFWPAPAVLPAETNIVFIAVRPEALACKPAWLEGPDAPPVIPVVSYENPIFIDVVMQLNAYCTVPSPVRSFGVLTAIAVSLHQHKNRLALERYAQRVAEKFADQRQIQRAKSILMSSRKLTEPDAYELLRSRAMEQRQSLEATAEIIIKAHESLHF
ncbi:ANTAR domain-containing protein [Caballeronia sp. dw_19]|uniref:ANTAR domain-containing response regulator n=1 Tax=unclassified Caballeronia TaxID=2646786 RepID=UPI001BD4A2A6|nr:ANTAR domain-containing protein [Caballeronia sp. dw_19]